MTANGHAGAAAHPLHDVAIAGVFNAAQGRVLEGHDSTSITLEAVRGVLADAGLRPADIDGVSAGELSAPLVHLLGLGPAWRSYGTPGIAGLLEAAAAVATGQCHTVLVAAGSAGIYTERASTAPWTRPANEFVVPWGMFTAAEFALIARTHMDRFGTTPEQLATVAATIRNNGDVNPEAIYRGRGPFTPADVLASRMIAEPYHLLDCAMTSEGGCALVLTTVERARDLPGRPAYLLGGAVESFGPSYRHPPSFDLGRRDPELVNGWVGRRAARKAFGMAGLGPADVDVCEFYDPFSFEIIRQFEAFGFCGDGEGGDFVTGGTIDVGGRYPVTTDGGTMAFSHGGADVQLLQRVIRGAQQVRGSCASRQVPDAEVALCTNGGAGALFTNVLLLGSERP